MTGLQQISHACKRLSENIASEYKYRRRALSGTPLANCLFLHHTIAVHCNIACKNDGIDRNSNVTLLLAIAAREHRRSRQLEDESQHLGRGHRFSEALEAVDGREVVVFPPTCYLDAVAKANKNVALGAQDACCLRKAARHRRRVALPMLKSMPRVDYVLCGHSERRSLFSDDDDAIRAKVRGALDAGFAAMLCIGETQQEYELGVTDDVCALQLAKALEGVTAAEMANIVVAYEPVWAIGTGLVCPADVAQRVHSSIRQRLRATYDSS